MSDDLVKKTCFKCLEQLPLNMFYRHVGMADGHLNKCKNCAKRDVSTNYRDNFAHYKLYEVERNKRPKRKEDRTKRTVKFRKENPEKYAAHTLVNNAVRDGKLGKLPCEVCGAVDSHGHHDDYNKPLDVVWLCPKHHVERHRKYNLVCDSET